MCCIKDLREQKFFIELYTGTGILITGPKELTAFSTAFHISLQNTAKKSNVIILGKGILTYS